MALHHSKKKLSRGVTSKHNYEFYFLNFLNRDHCYYTSKYRGAGSNISNLRYSIPREIPIVFHTGMNYDYRFIITELAKEFKGGFNSLG